MQQNHKLTLPKENRKVFPDVPVVGCQNGRSLQDYLVRTKLPKLEESRRCEPCWKRTCLVCDSISTTTTVTTEACQGTFKIQEGPLSSDTKKMLYLLKCQICGEVSFVGKAKTKFCYRFNNYESTHRAFRNGKRKVPRKSFHTIYLLS